MKVMKDAEDYMGRREQMRELHRRLTDAGIEYRCDEPLSRHTTLRIGGNAAVAILPTSEEEVRLALSFLKELCVPLFVIGGGSNLLAPDRGFDGAVLLTGGLSALSVEVSGEGGTVTAGAGVPLAMLARAAERAGLTGAEFLYGIPGTVGGATVMNAGAYGGEIGQILASSRYIDVEHPCDVWEMSLAEHRYGYRASAYLEKPSLLVLSVTLQLKCGDRDAISAEMARMMAQRREKQPLEYPSAGSFFKRPVGTFAGKLIEDCGLKGYRIGGAEISEKHAGFLLNRGGATEADVRALAAHVREVVLRETGYLLESEVQVMEGNAP